MRERVEKLQRFTVVILPLNQVGYFIDHYRDGFRAMVIDRLGRGSVQYFEMGSVEVLERPERIVRDYIFEVLRQNT